MFSLLFSFKGRIKRGKFFVTSLLTAVLTIAALVSLLMPPVSEAMRIHGPGVGAGDLDIGAPIALIALLIFGMGVWVQMSLLWKRTRDMNEGMAVAYIYATCAVLSVIPFLGLIFGTINMVLAGVLIFKPSRATVDDAIDPEIFGSESQSDDVAVEPTSDFASNLSDADLVARAAQLREPMKSPSMATPDAPVENAGRAAPKSFGRRSRVQH